MKRRTVAFFIAPLAVPLLLLPWLSSGNSGGRMDTDGDCHRGTGELHGHSRFGGAAYFVLRARGLTAAWIAGAVGFVTGRPALPGFFIRRIGLSYVSSGLRFLTPAKNP
jgi:hypothetical protein